LQGATYLAAGAVVVKLVEIRQEQNDLGKELVEMVQAMLKLDVPPENLVVTNPKDSPELWVYDRTTHTQNEVGEVVPIEVELEDIPMSDPDKEMIEQLRKELNPLKPSKVVYADED
jgi:hypothetical protein